MAEEVRPTEDIFPSQGVQASRAPSRTEVPPSESTLGAVGALTLTQPEKHRPGIPQRT